MTADKNSAKARFDLLDGLRGIAALAVVTDHVEVPWVQRLIPFCGGAVDFFFVLSGFVLAHAYGERLKSGGAWVFMKARLIRLYPMLIAAMALFGAYACYLKATGAWLYSEGQILAAMGFGLLFLPSPLSVTLDPATRFSTVGPAYSMFFELAGNIVYALIAPILSVRLLLLIIICNGALLVWATYLYYTPTLGWETESFWAGFPRIGFSFFTGVLIYRLRAFWTRFALPAWAAALLLALILIAPGLRYDTPADLTYARLYGAVAVLILLPLLVALSAGAKVTGAAASVCRTIGRLSYGFYLLHEPLFELLNAVFVDSRGQELTSLGAVSILIVVLAAGALAWVLDRYYDAPLRRWLTARFLRPAAIKL